MKEPVDSQLDMQAIYRLPCKNSKRSRPIVVQFNNRQKCDSFLKKGKGENAISCFENTTKETNSAMVRHALPEAKLQTKARTLYGVCAVWRGECLDTASIVSNNELKFAIDAVLCRCAVPRLCRLEILCLCAIRRLYAACETPRLAMRNRRTNLRDQQLDNFQCARRDYSSVDFNRAVFRYDCNINYSSHASVCIGPMDVICERCDVLQKHQF
ncbi:hypothetical protein J6590_059696 [Homalodisca vitripennis]|nr:hypothetical protein J6590_059696 [Homalodisca vitripennis]